MYKDNIFRNFIVHLTIIYIPTNIIIFLNKILTLSPSSDFLEFLPHSSACRTEVLACLPRWTGVLQESTGIFSRLLCHSGIVLGCSYNFGSDNTSEKKNNRMLFSY